MRTDGNDGRMQNFFLQDEIVANEVKEDIQYGIESATSRIPEGSQRNKFLKGRIEKIYRRYDEFLGHFFQKRCKAN